MMDIVEEEEIQQGSCEKTKLGNEYVGKRKGLKFTWKL